MEQTQHSEYFKKIVDSVKVYINSCGYHLTEEEVIEGVKNIIEEVYAERDKIVLVDMDVNPPELIDLTDPENVKRFKFKSFFAFIKPRHFLNRIKTRMEQMEREKIFNMFRPYKSKIITAQVIGETFFLGDRVWENVEIFPLPFKGTLRDFGMKYGMYVEGGKELIEIPTGTWKMWDIAKMIFEQTGYVASINPHKNLIRVKRGGKAVVFSIYGIDAIMPSDERAPGEHYEIGKEYEVFLYDVNMSQRQGYQLYVSRKKIDFLLEYIYIYFPFLRGKVLSVAREPGLICKILYKNSGGRIKWGEHKEQIALISQKLNGEAVEFVEYTKDPEEFLRKALNFDGIIKIDSFNKQATIITTKKGAVIGKNGVNVKLAGMLTGYKINVFTPDEEIDKMLSTSTITR